MGKDKPKSKSKKTNDRPDFKKKRTKVGHKKQKPDSYTDTTLKFKRLVQVKNKLTGLDAVCHQILNETTSVRHEGYKQLHSILKEYKLNQQQIDSRSQYLINLIFRGLNDEEKQIYHNCGEILILLTSTQIIQTNRQYFQIQCKLMLNNHYIMNRQNFIQYINNRHLDYLSVEFVNDFVNSLNDPTTENKALDCCIYLVEQVKQQNSIEKEVILTQNAIQSGLYNITNNAADYFDINNTSNNEAQLQFIINFINYVKQTKITKLNVNVESSNCLSLSSQIQQQQIMKTTIISFRYLQLLYSIKNKYFNKYNQQITNLFDLNLQFPIYNQYVELQFQFNAYYYLLTNCEEFRIANELQYCNQFFTEQKQANQQICQTKDYIQYLLDQIQDKSTIKDSILHLLTNNKIDHKYLSLFDDKCSILLKCKFFDIQTYVNELCKLILKSKETEYCLLLQMSQLVFEKVNQQIIDEMVINNNLTVQQIVSKIDRQRFNQMTIQGKEVKVSKILVKKLGKIGVVQALCQLLATE